ncbi:hypothetical protein [Phytomonospora endophytica]|uniref:Uncharacterized protein n=1 Tax=Phytomonospora endophytica TaxID=714109 RepID=A0A841FKH8_9ACTN|nr:hypothetical protein [Phytomonospora endophytica]MBB6033667.1 hypothetical protein [Phytomonospora endophytica]
MTPEEIDTELRQHDLTHRRFAEELYALDNAGAHSYLRDGELTGLTGKAAAESGTRLSALWSQFGALGTVVDRAKELRSRRTRLAEPEHSELTMLLREDVVSLGADGLRPGDSGGEVTERVSLPDLTKRMNGSVTALKDLYAEVDAACARVAERLSSLTAAVDDAERLTELLDLTTDTTDPDGLAALERELTVLRGAALADPLDPAVTGRLDGFAARVTPVLASLAALDTLRTGLPERLLLRRSAIAELAAAEKEAAEITAVVEVKIAQVRIPALSPQASPLRQRLGDLRRLAAAGRWRLLAERLEQIDRDVTAAREAAATVNETATALMDRRAELRGRLKAYQMKAGRTGAAESAEITSQYEIARALLWTAPCDLRAATRAVRDFQQALLATEESG